jgi:hypothetical protein
MNNEKMMKEPCGDANTTHVGMTLVLYIKTKNLKVDCISIFRWAQYEEIPTSLCPRYSYCYVPMIWTPWYRQVHIKTALNHGVHLLKQIVSHPRTL